MPMIKKILKKTKENETDRRNSRFQANGIIVGFLNFYYLCVKFSAHSCNGALYSFNECETKGGAQFLRIGHTLGLVVIRF